MNTRDVLDQYLDEAMPDFVDMPGLEVNQRGRFDNYPLNIASTRGKPDEVRALLNGGADVSAVGEMGNTALHDAISAGSMPVIKLLLDAGAPLDVRNEFGETPLEMGLASEDTEVRSLFESIAAGGDGAGGADGAVDLGP
jgi:ankyrin repeat protein